MDGSDFTDVTLEVVVEIDDSLKGAYVIDFADNEKHIIYVLETCYLEFQILFAKGSNGEVYHRLS